MKVKLKARWWRPPRKEGKSISVPDERRWIWFPQLSALFLQSSLGVGGFEERGFFWLVWAANTGRVAYIRSCSGDIVLLSKADCLGRIKQSAYVCTIKEQTGIDIQIWTRTTKDEQIKVKNDQEQSEECIWGKLEVNACRNQQQHKSPIQVHVVKWSEQHWHLSGENKKLKEITAGWSERRQVQIHRCDSSSQALGSITSFPAQKKKRKTCMRLRNCPLQGITRRGNQQARGSEVIV